MADSKLPKSSISKSVLLFLVASYGVTNFILIVLALIANHRGKKYAKKHTDSSGPIGWDPDSYGPYSFVAAAASICCLTAIVMALNIAFRARKLAVDPLYVFRGVFFTLLVMAPVLIMGWLHPSYVYTRSDEILSAAVDSSLSTRGICSELSDNLARYVGLIQSKGNIFNAPDGAEDVVQSFLDTTEGKDIGSILDTINGSRVKMIGMAGTFVARQLHNLRGASTVTLAHFNVVFGAIVAGIAAAMAPPAGIQVGAPGSMGTA
ncbi:hypothetical protein QQS21_008898 [Conoideocrella luteorostrata]|uniref:Uncharacterized protein n=1 Tax=Conoideocrella luteorostrata TaxID=1105319 RepID=A0AAJ0CI91_9HYPO|nr:hypothetical protein QQS21_008898 [Conoideocrella luteorostrata]